MNEDSPTHSQQPPGGGGPDFVLKLIIVGDTNTGKSAILHQFIEGKFKSNQAPKHTIGVEFASRVLALSGRKVKINVWDTAGQERFRSVTHSYYRGALGCLLVYDVANRGTFNSLKEWISNVRTLTGTQVSIVLCGNKSDLSEDDRQVSLLEGSRFAQENDCMFLETSALSGTNVEEAFMKLSRTVLNKVEMGVIDPNSPNLHGGTLRSRQQRLAPSSSAPSQDEAKASQFAGCSC